MSDAEKLLKECWMPDQMAWHPNKPGTRRECRWCECYEDVGHGEGCPIPIVERLLQVERVAKQVPDRDADGDWDIGSMMTYCEDMRRLVEGGTG